ncbi:MAG: hypothetical protein RMK29_08180 [Myxococcales bacterium]|nr:hypothetical protein [Myxococcota bacterium]MDW8281671.1 hypothetical protein [Myxococcales bacterium]
MSCLLGTTFALRQRDPAEGLPNADLVRDEAMRCEATGLLLCEGLPPELLVPLVAQLRRDTTLPIVAVDGQLGASWRGRPQLARACLGSLDRDEARAALERSLAALELAAEGGAQAVWLRLGEVAAVAARWDGLRRRFLRGELLSDPEPAQALMQQRCAAAAPHLGACLRGLERLARAAEQRGLQLLVRNPRRALELPTPAELSVLRLELAGAPLSPLLDVPAAHLGSAMRLVPLRETITAFCDGPLCLLGDACGALGALPPGQGEVDVAAVARALPTHTQVAFVPWPGLHLSEVALGCQRVASLPRRTG